jgi:ABC-2 type transport system permease protein
MFGKVFLKTLRDQWKSVFWWGFGIGMFALMVVWLYPAYGGSQIMSIYEGMPDALKAFFGETKLLAGFNGFLSLEFFSWVPLIVAVYAIGEGSFALVGEEEKGTMDLLLSYPVKRWQVVVEKAAAMLVNLFLIMGQGYLWFLISIPLVGVESDLGALALATLNTLPLLFVLGALSLFCSALLRSRGSAALVATVVLIVSYFLDSFGKLVDKLAPYRPASIYYYFANKTPLNGGMDWGGFFLLTGLGVLFVALALVAFQRKDLAV